MKPEETAGMRHAPPIIRNRLFRLGPANTGPNGTTVVGCEHSWQGGAGMTVMFKRQRQPDSA